ncbi:MAG: competence/damage-inducible protein A [Alphaproteobacteria bacterium]|nr:competence/damage-inducible protein A [Alphaproteobacteria bacterium]
MAKIYTAALVVIGNEILSGRTQDKNINYIADKLVECGVELVEVRIVPDEEEAIVAAVQELTGKVMYLFTTGGIGPTHDDITAESVAKALGIPLVNNSQAYEMLKAHYGPEKFTPPRQKMARIPRGAKLIPNPLSISPGFISKNVYVMAGVPEIMMAMVDYIARTIKGGDVILSKTVHCRFPESVIADDLAFVQERFKEDVNIGSYPYFEDGNFGVSIVLRSSNKQTLVRAVMEVDLLVSSFEGAAISDSELEFAVYDMDNKR